MLAPSWFPSLDRLAARESFMNPFLLFSRIIMSYVHIHFGIAKGLPTSKAPGIMEAHGIPGELVWVGVIDQTLGAIFVLLGFQTRLGALMVAGFCIVATSLFHSDFSQPGELSTFTKDYALAGGMFFLFAYGPGGWSLDAFMARKKTSR